MSDVAYLLPPHSLDSTWDAPRARGKCCDLDVAMDLCKLLLSDGMMTGFDGNFGITGDHGSTDASNEKASLLALFASTSPAGLAVDAAGVQSFQVLRSDSYGTPDPGTGLAPFTAGATLSADGAGPGITGTAGGGANGEFAQADADYPGTYPAHSTALGNFFRSAIRFRVTLDPPWREADQGADIKVEYVLRSQAWVKTGGTWVTSGAPTDGSVVTVTIAEPALDATEAVAAAWINVSGSAGTSVNVITQRAYVNRTCAGD